MCPMYRSHARFFAVIVFSVFSVHVHCATSFLVPDGVIQTQKKKDSLLLCTPSYLQWLRCLCTAKHDSGDFFFKGERKGAFVPASPHLFQVFIE